jgi:hypothetical protein
MALGGIGYPPLQYFSANHMGWTFFEKNCMDFCFEAFFWRKLHGVAWHGLAYLGIP